ncbi:flagellar assembly peptidoglycan hydrolase FlgJ [Shewanella avicenniae]|uniref:Peptidoglycan hydrolase FlgJ n=1 Tax=Shewanella avicenniae TaxID=2814294 RepID=A0ABX7QPU8_9GAMM|nr:flagellar assembly peptidoglycan hydrolase FlgJ [Shewanella avicenniae]QSX32735.1 flagellar assembly peptidoglycan hydrolase FlgJ [Shewanella avicenniae]
MNRLADTTQFMDLAGLDNLRSKALTDQKAALKEVAQQFEGIFVQMLMKSMREANAAFESDSPLNSQYTKFYEGMHDQQMSVNLSSKGMLGLADLMVQQLSPEGSNMTPASALHGQHGALAKDFNTSPQATAAANDTNLNSSENAVANTAATSSAINPELMALQQLSAKDIAAIEQKQPTALPQQAQLAAVLRGQKLPTQAAVEDLASPAQFVKTLYPYAKDAAEKLGTTPEVLLAQSALETGWGQKMTKAGNGQSSNNLFNIKAGNRWAGNTTVVDTLEYEQGHAVTKKEDFRVYDSIKASFDDYVQLINGNERYQTARDSAANPAAFIKGLADAGYATDPQYAQKVMRVLQSIKQDVGQWLGSEAQSVGASTTGAISYGN